MKQCFLVHLFLLIYWIRVSRAAEFQPGEVVIPKRLVPLIKKIRFPSELEVRRKGRQTGCVYNTKNYGDGEEWDYYTSDKAITPYYGFKLKCNAGSTDVVGCYENELLVPVDGRKPSKEYDGFDMLCATSGFSYEASENQCAGYNTGDIFDQGFYRYQCTDSGLTVIACLDLDGNTHKPDDIYDVLEAYRMKCFETDNGLVVEAIACIDEDANLIAIGENVKSGWYRRECQDKRDESGLQTAIALNLTMCCEITTDHCITAGVDEPSILFPDLTFSCVQTDDEFTYRYFGQDGKEVTIPSGDIPTTIDPNAPDVTTPTLVATQPATTPLPVGVTTTVTPTELITTTAASVEPKQASQPPGAITTADPNGSITTVDPNANGQDGVTTGAVAPVSPATVTVTVVVTQQPATPAPTSSRCCRIETPVTTPNPDIVYVTVTQTIGGPTMPSTIVPTTTPKVATVTPSLPKTVYVTVTEIYGQVTTPQGQQTITVTQTVSAMPNTDVVPVTKYVCPDGYILRGDSCYLYSNPDKAATAEEAEKNCIKDGGRLLVISNQAEWEFVQRQLEAIRKQYPAQAFDGFWIGLRYSDTAQKWEWIRPGGWEQIPWMLRERQARMCGEVWHSGTRWGIGQDSCNHKQWYICEREKDEVTPVPVPDDGDCDEGWSQFRGKCYFVSRPSSRLGSADAAQLCANYQAMLVVIDDLAEWDFVESEAKRKAVATADGGYDGFWIGLSQEDRSGRWDWVREGGLNQQNLELDCLKTDQRQWGVDKDQCAHQQGYICEKDLAGRQGIDDDCRVYKNRCPETAECIDTGRGYKCVCILGYQGDGYFCEDIDECRRRQGLCDSNSYCKNLPGTYECYCYNGYKKDQSTGKCVEFGTCISYGDPHYRTFDGAAVHYMGTCRNILVDSNVANYGIAKSGRGRRRRRQAGGAPPFRVESRSEYRDGVNDMSWIRDIFFLVRGSEIGLLKDGVVTVDGARVNLPFTWKSRGATAVIRRSPKGVVYLSSELGVDVIYNGKDRGEVQLLSRYKRQVRGMCGNYNDDKGDDFARPDGSMTRNLDDLGNSWLASGGRGKRQTGNDRDCEADTAAQSGCMPGSRAYQEAQSFCVPLTRRSGVFGSCYSGIQLDPESFFRACAMDVCANGPRVACAEFENVADLCAERGFPLASWRAQLGCPGQSCAANEESQSCGPSCPESCASRAGQKQRACVQQCVEGCFCRPGFIRSGNVCVRPEQCGCLVDAQVYVNIGEYFFRDNCQEFCRCVDEGGVPRTQCGAARCHQSARCSKLDSIQQCVCAPGFVGNGISCNDVDECRMNRADCGLGQSCVNTIGSYTCGCQEGFEASRNGDCVDVNECTALRNPCGDPVAKCSNLRGGYDCSCPLGHLMKVLRDGSGGGRGKRQAESLRKWNVDCQDVDECLLRQNSCDPNTSDCVNTVGSYVCRCVQGYAVEFGVCKKSEACRVGSSSGCHRLGECVSLNGQSRCVCLPGYDGDGLSSCVDRDECAPRGPCSSEARCVNTPGSFHCDCGVGFRSVNDFFCEDVDECMNDACGRNAACTNTYGSYSCGCGLGYKSLNGICQDEDECAANQQRCDPNAACVNSQGSYTCRCKDGFQGNGFVCQPVSGCESCPDRGACGANAVCYSDTGAAKGVRCACAPGFTGDGYNCVDINECFSTSLSNPCPRGAECRNSIGSYRCECADGMEAGQGSGGVGCRDSDECSRRPCDSSAICSNTFQGFKCLCSLGFTGSGRPGQCYDVDECSAGGSVVCGGSAECVNTQGSFLCRCRPGYAGQPCRDINECRDFNMNQCSPDATCINTEGSYQCSCNNGFSGSGRVCQRTDACSSKRGECDPNAYCVDTPGSSGPECRCKEGFVGTGNSCRDVNECMESAGLCGPGSVCRNSLGSFACVCGPGFVQRGEACEDVDECRTECKGDNHVCRNSFGGFVCACKPGFDGPECRDVDECAKACEAAGSACDRGIHPYCPDGSKCVNLDGDFACVMGQARSNPANIRLRSRPCEFSGPECDRLHMRCVGTPARFKCECEAGWQLITVEGGGWCADLDECAAALDNCDVHARCLNTLGSFFCSCREGFTGNGVQCRPESQCRYAVPLAASLGLRRPGGCDPRAECSNATGLFRCRCSKGYRGDGIRACEDIDECVGQTFPCGENASCANTQGSFECHCRDGFEGDAAKGCTAKEGGDEIECNCGFGGTCVVDARSKAKVCLCLPGFTGGSSSCRDINECVEGRHNCTGIRSRCYNTKGGFKCLCQDGFKDTGRACVDIDECAETNSLCGERGECRNSPGSFQCQCAVGFAQDPYQPSVCQDINECTAGIANCGARTLCANSPGSYSCRCDAGYVWDGEVCRDVDECSEVNGPCGSNARCVNFEGAYRCLCEAGFTGDANAGCSLVSSCLTSGASCSASAVCVDEAGGAFRCRCNDGFQGDGVSCRDVDECAVLGDVACGGRACRNSPGSFHCDCESGFRAVASPAGTDHCRDIDECSDNGGICGEAKQCTNTPGSYACHCQSGYQEDEKGVCTDVDECFGTSGDNLCPEDARCRNIIGSFTCDCRNGKIWDADFGLCADGDAKDMHRKCEEGMALERDQQCQDIDECSLGIDNCPDKALCQNSIGSFKCQCLSGYKLDGLQCVDVDECAELKLCHKEASCINLDGSFLCHCDGCFRGDGFVCEADPCCNCHVNATCQRDVCRCKSGFIGDGKTCKDACDGNRCHAEADCRPDGRSSVGYACKCRGELEGDGFDCVLKHAQNCVRLSVDCGNGTCLSGAAGFDDWTCLCPKGFQFREGTCLDYDECELEIGRRCGLSRRCVNTHGGYECVCRVPGLVWDEQKSRCVIKTRRRSSKRARSSITLVTQRRRFGRSITEPSSCHHGGSAMCERLNAVCQMVPQIPPFICRCRYNAPKNDHGVCLGRHRENLARKVPIHSPGFRCPEGFHFLRHLGQCIDVNECQKDSCPANMACKNLEGGFHCSCRDGFLLNCSQNYIASAECVDVDECGEAICGETEFCANSPGSFKCECIAGYFRRHAEYACQPISSREQCDALCGPRGHCEDVGGRLRCVCEPGFALERGRPNSPPGARVLINECVDIDECSVGLDTCSRDAECRNTDGSFACVCRRGFVGDGFSCEAQEWCGGLCAATADCVSEGAVSHCVCNPGHVGNGKRCFPDLCTRAEPACPETASCLVDKTDGHLSCLCYSGFSGSKCTDIDECAGEESPCGPNLKCHNLPGSYACLCPVGYSGSPDTGCQDIDECRVDSANKCGANADCVNVPGSYQCRCHNGYKGNGLSCSRVEGCDSDSDCKGSAVCKGSACACPFGYASSSPGTEPCKDIDECSGAEATFRCGRQRKCVNFAGGFRCDCPAGFAKGSGQDCVDVDECGGEKLACPRSAECVNTLGSFECACPKGYRMNTTAERCIDLNECVANPCDANAVCHNMPGGFRCQCSPGFTGNGLRCVDADECSLGTIECGAADCVNSIGSYSCQCKSGYQLIDEKCADIDECASNISDCHVGLSSCSNTIGSYKCQCNPGYTGDGRHCGWLDPCLGLRCGLSALCLSGGAAGAKAACTCLPGYEGDPNNACTAIDYCGEGNAAKCSPHASCESLADSAICTCKPGYRGNGQECEDVNECAEAGICDEDVAVCVNGPGSFHCDCRVGFARGSESSACEDVNECDNSSCKKGHMCVNTFGSFTCHCPDGYFGENCGAHSVRACKSDGDSCGRSARCANGSCECLPGFHLNSEGHCQDMDECETEENCGKDAFCRNTPGSYSCSCLDGFAGNGVNCVDVDECAVDGGSCALAAVCTNAPGSFTCRCPENHEGDGFTCVPPAASLRRDTHNARLNAQFGRASKWDHNNTICRCSPGFTGDPYLGCHDINECNEARDSLGGCSIHADCENTIGSFRCTCKDGLTGDATRECFDIDECEASGPMCRGFSSCSNTFGSFDCQCLPGYRKDANGNCIDIDECNGLISGSLNAANPCHPAANCLNSLGSFLCQCPDDLVGDGINECREADACDSEGTCGPHSQCLRSALGGHECVCKAGFLRRHDLCLDVDECAAGLSDCPTPTADCRNTIGSFVCTCAAGFRGDGHNCRDVDECARAGACGWGAVCENSFGSFSCICQAGLRRSANETCEDVDECAEDASLCGVHKCVNLIGSFTCDCKSGYRFSNLHSACLDIDECLESGEEVCGAAGVCFNSLGGYSCACKSGFRISDTTNATTVCVDVNECENGVVCSNGGTCRNTPGSFVCHCPRGFQVFGLNCVDIDECAEPEGSSQGASCHKNADCYNRIGHYNCQCRPGFIGNGQRCRDEDECAAESGSARRCGEFLRCVNTVGGFRCVCDGGYRAASASACRDVDECRERGACADVAGAECRNSRGSFSCVCPDGYRLNDAASACVDVDECASASACPKGLACVNVPGSFSCRCHAGFRLKGERCVDVDECDWAPCPPDAVCRNAPGSFACECRPGFHRAEFGCGRICGLGVCGPLQRCQVDDKTKKANCICDMAAWIGRYQHGEICTTRRKYFRSKVEMLQHSCNQHVVHTVDYYSKCKDDCALVACEGRGSCRRNAASGFPTCVG